MNSIPHVVDARHKEEYKVEVVFDDGKKGVVDLSKYPEKGGVFAPLSDLDLLQALFY